MRLTDLRDKIVRTLDGDAIGRVHEVHAEGGRIVALSCGAASLIERLTAKSYGERIAWERVVKVTPREVVVGPEAPARKAKAVATRSRQGIRRASAQRSKR
jgi:sporulation protein YlmC with PRC-barrel domain